MYANWDSVVKKKKTHIRNAHNFHPIDMACHYHEGVFAVCRDADLEVRQKGALL